MYVNIIMIPINSCHALQLSMEYAKSNRSIICSPKKYDLLKETRYYPISYFLFLPLFSRFTLGEQPPVGSYNFSCMSVRSTLSAERLSAQKMNWTLQRTAKHTSTKRNAWRRSCRNPFADWRLNTHTALIKHLKKVKAAGPDGVPLKWATIHQP